jgi:hypothetical protein
MHIAPGAELGDDMPVEMESIEANLRTARLALATSQ